MKKLIFFCIGAMIATAAMSQACVTNAYNSNLNGEKSQDAAKFVKAAEYIEQCMDNAKAIAKEKTWRYRGKIYYNIAVSPEVSKDFPNALSLSKESYLKAMELDKKGSYEDENKGFLENIRRIALNTGTEKFQANDMKGAEMDLKLTNEISEMNGVTDTVAMYGIYNLGLVYDKAGNLEGAMTQFKKAIELNYQPEATYNYMATLLFKAQKPDEALELLKEARGKFPNSKDLIFQVLNHYLDPENPQYDKAKMILVEAIQIDPTNELLHFAQGSVMDQIGETEGAIAAYKKALELKPDYFDANYNLGALYYNKGAELWNEATAIPMNQKKKYEAAKLEANKQFEAALPFLEKAHMLDSADRDTILSLKELYARLDMLDKMMEMKGLLEAAK